MVCRVSEETGGCSSVFQAESKSNCYLAIKHTKQGENNCFMVRFLKAEVWMKGSY